MSVLPFQSFQIISVIWTKESKEMRGRELIRRSVTVYLSVGGVWTADLPTWGGVQIQSAVVGSRETSSLGRGGEIYLADYSRKMWEDQLINLLDDHRILIEAAEQWTVTLRCAPRSAARFGLPVLQHTACMVGLNSSREVVIHWWIQENSI